MSAVALESSLAELVDRVRSASALHRPLRIRAGGTKDWLGETLQGEVFDVRAHAGIVEYEPSELVVTARCGTPLAEVEAALAERDQMLAFEPPHFGAGATVGGCVAAGLSGPRRAAYGTASGAVRDYVLGVRLIDGRGDVLRFGGTVMKNVAGYDVSRLIAGSLGVLGVIADVTLKVLPCPQIEATLSFEFDEASMLRTVNAWAGQPWPISASAWRPREAASHSGTLGLRLSGSQAAVSAALGKLGGERLEAARADAFWRGIREQTDAFFGGVARGEGAPLWRLSVPSATPALGLAGDRLIEWNGALRWLRTDAPAAQVRAAASGAGGAATLWRTHPAHAGVARTARLPEGLLAIHRRLKQEFDPADIFNRGRLFADL